MKTHRGLSTTHATPSGHANRPQTSLGLGWASTTGPASTAAASGISRPHQTGFGLVEGGGRRRGRPKAGDTATSGASLPQPLTKDILLTKLGSVQSSPTSPYVEKSLYNKIDVSRDTIPCNTMKNHKIPYDAMQYHTIQSNIMQYQTRG